MTKGFQYSLCIKYSLTPITIYLHKEHIITTTTQLVAASFEADQLITCHTQAGTQAQKDSHKKPEVEVKTNGFR